MRANHRDLALALLTSMRLRGRKQTCQPLGVEMETPIRTSPAVRAEIHSFTTLSHELRGTFDATQPHPSLAEGLCSRVAARSPARKDFWVEWQTLPSGPLVGHHHRHLGQIVAERFAADPSTVVSLTTDVSGSGVRPHL